MTALMHYLSASHLASSRHQRTLLDRIWSRVKTAISGPAYDLT